MIFKYLLVFIVFLTLVKCTNAEDYKVKSAEEIKAVSKKVQPGDRIIMADGIWTDAHIIFEAKGEKGKPIILMAETPGKVILNGKSQLKMSGEYLVADGLYFKGGKLQPADDKVSKSAVIEFRTSGKKVCRYSRLTNTAIEDYNADSITTDYKWVSLYGDHNRVDHCFFKGKNHLGTVLVVWLSEEPNYHLIDSNYFGTRPELGMNGAEIIRIGTSEWSQHYSNTTVEHNYFYQCNGEREIISSKSWGNIYRGNTFVECQGTLTLRHGNKCIVEGNYFFGNKVAGTGGVRIIGEDHKVINNYFCDLRGEDVFSALPLMNGVPNSPLNRYFQVKNALVANNVFVNNKYNIVIGTGANEELSLSPENCRFENNIITGSDKPIIKEISKPKDFIWKGNIFHGKELGIEKTDGISVEEPKLTLSEDGIWRPGNTKPESVKDHPVKPSEAGPSWMAAKKTGISETNTKLPELIFINSGRLSEAKSSPGSKEYSDAVAKLKRDAEKALKLKPLSVTEKAQVPPSGDKHDYMSLGKYWFPDPTKPEGKPYIRKDGEVNPETKDFPDHDNLSVMINTVCTLAIANHVLGAAQYSEHAARMLKVWFLEPETRMNPNLDFAQAIPGKSEGRGSGIVDAHRLSRLVDAVELLRGTKAWTDEDNEKMKKWFTDYLKWLMESKNGKSEAKAKNNHGSWYEVQVASIAYYLGKKDLAGEIIKGKSMERISMQIMPDGKQPEELVRTKSLHYSMFNIEALFNLAIIGDKVGTDLWNYKLPDGRGIQKALDYMMPFLNGEKSWEYKQITEVKPEEFFGIIKIASIKYPGDELVRRYMEKFSGEKSKDISNIIY